MMTSILQLAFAAALALLAGCGSKPSENRTLAFNNKSAASPPAAPRPPPPGPAPQLSSNFDFNAMIPAEFTCDGKGEPPPLNWTEPLDGTRSFALVVDDPDAPGGTFYHWGVYDIPATTRSIAGGHAPGRTLVNDFGKAGYGPPCPPRGTGLHHYRFKLYGLSVSHLELKPNASVADLQAAILHAAEQGKVPTESLLMTYYERKQLSL